MDRQGSAGTDGGREDHSNALIFGLGDIPRIRDITGIRIHQLTLPESLFYASKLVHDRDHDNGEHHDVPGYSCPTTLGESSTTHLVESPESAPFSSFRHRRSSSTSTSVAFPFPSPTSQPSHHGSERRDRERRTSDTPLSSALYRPKHERRSTTSSAGTVTPIQSPSFPTFSNSSQRTRVTRPRAPTLAGEALEHTLSPNLSLHVEHVDEDVQVKPARLARCFVVLKLPRRPDNRINGHEDGGVPLPKQSNGHRPSRSSEGTDKGRPRLTSSSSSSSSISNRIRPPLSTSSSSSSTSTSITPTSPHASVLATRQRTTSLGSSNKPAGAAEGNGKRSSSSTSERRTPLRWQPSRLAEPGSRLPTSPRVAIPNGNGHTVSRNSQSHKPNGTKSPSDKCSRTSPPIIPFYVSPIHAPSTHPQFLSLMPETDFAPWLTVEEAASSELIMEIWVESLSPDFAAEETQIRRWVKVEDLGGMIRLGNLRRKGKEALPDGTIQFTLSSDPKALFYLPTSLELNGVSLENDVGAGAGAGIGAVERSLRETKMKRGVGVGGLHQLVNMYAVITDTERSIAQVQAKLNELLRADSDWRRIRREIAEREDRVKWFNEKISEVDNFTAEIRAKTILRRQELNTRRRHLAEAEEQDRVLRAQAEELQMEIEAARAERLSLVPQTLSLQAHHIQTLDVLFPILPLDPSSLLYTINSVPLPIPSDPKDPAPPLTLPAHKVDERTTAAALGYVGMVVLLLSGLGQVGLPYPITAVGSRSLVRDVVSVMQGPRSFPLFAKGVERYRYEYAVFLLNKNIEMLMQESNIRLLDLRHTLPNLKNLLLTLSSTDLPPRWDTSALGKGKSVHAQVREDTVGSRRPSTIYGPASASASAVGTPTKSPLSVGVGRGGGVGGFDKHKVVSPLAGRVGAGASIDIGQIGNVATSNRTGTGTGGNADGWLDDGASAEEDGDEKEEEG